MLPWAAENKRTEASGSVSNKSCLLITQAVAFVVAQFLGPVGIPTVAFALDSNRATNHHANSLCNRGNNKNNNSWKCWGEESCIFPL